MENSHTPEKDFSEQIITYWMEDCLNDVVSKNVFQFCKLHSMEESQFYAHFSSLDHLQSKIWVTLFQSALSLLVASENFAKYDEKNKLISLYITLFETFTLNRSYLIESLPKDLKDFKQLKQLHLLRKELKEFSKSHLYSMNQTIVSEKLSSITHPIMEEGIWVQFLFILHFWVHDTSPNFEKTDIIIEKSVVTSFDLMNTKPLESLVDLGKFLWKERM